MSYKKGVMVKGQSGGVHYIGIINGINESDMYEIHPAVVQALGTWYNMETPLLEKNTITNEVTPDDFDIFHDISKEPTIHIAELLAIMVMPPSAGAGSRSKGTRGDSII